MKIVLTKRLTLRVTATKFLNFGLKVQALLLCSLLLFPPQLVFAASPVASGATNTTVTPAGNGVPVVNIAAPSAAGLSHNTYTSYNVDAQGLVLNNGDKSQTFRQSQLAGVVAANPNLAAGNQASIILNEVTSNNRSILAGFTEVLGGKAAVIVANPFGITCNGCGFINTDRASLVTGTPNLTAGALTGFGVNGGDILVTGTGINASAQQTLDLVSRKIVFQGQVNAQTLNVTAGTNTWDYNSGATSALAAAGGDPLPDYAIDSSALGGMYAGRINLKATEAGVGVRVLGNAAASTDDFIINSVGKIEIASKLSAARDLTITSTSAGADAIKATDANLSAGRNLALTASSGGATLSGGVLVATNDLKYTLGTLTDIATGTVLTDNNKRYGATAALNGTGAWTMDGVNYGSAGAFSATTGSLSIGDTSPTTLYSGSTLGLTATSGAFTLGNVGLQSVNDMTLSASSATSTGILTIGSAAQAKSTTGNMNLNAWYQLLNSGVLTTNTGNIVIRSGSGVSSDTRLVNQGAGSIWAGGQLNIADRDGLSTQNVLLSGTSKMGGNTVDISASRLDMTDTAVLTSPGNMRLYLASTGSGVIDAGAKILAATSGTGTLTLQTNIASGWQGIRNNGLIHSGQDIASINLGVGSEDYGAGTVSAVRNMSLAGFDAMYGNYIAGNDLTIGSDYGQVNLLPNSGDGSPNAMLSAGNDISITGARVRNWSVMNAARDITINASDLFTNAIGDASRWGFRYYDMGTDSLVSSTAYRAQIIAGRTITIAKGSNDYGQNAGIISAPTVNMSGAGIFSNADTIRGTSVNITIANFRNAAGGTSSTGAATGTSPTPVSTPGGVSFGGVVITIPTTPNGVFIPAASPGSHYLVESNPLYTNVDNYLGSDYLAEKYNFKSDEVIKRLGDAGYETYLVQQQLIGLAGTNLLTGYASEKAQMQGLMDHAGSQAKTLGLTYGTALSSTQQANLKEDMIWMVETTVSGQKVLAPVVYLAASTRQMFDGAPTVAADTINMNVASLNNAGTIKGNTINVTSTGDVRNTGGTIKGGDVSLSSTGGSVINEAAVNETVINRGGYVDVQTTAGKGGTITGTGNVSLSAAKNVENLSSTIQGGDVSIKAGGDVVNKTLVLTNVGGTSLRQTTADTGSISATNNLDINAGRDVQNLGAQLSAGKDASITAGRDVTFDTVSLANRDTTTTSDHSFVKNSDSSTTTTSITQVQGGLTTGGNLAITAKNDVTLASANLSAGKDASVDAGGDLNILARSNSLQSLTQSSGSGVGVGDGLLGKEKSTTDAFTSRAVVSNVAAGSITTGSEGNLSLSAGKTVILEGAKVNATGDIKIAAEDVQVLTAKDVDRTTTTKETTSYLAVSKGDSAKSGGTTASGATSGSSAVGGAKADSLASAGAATNYSKDLGGVDFSKTTTTKTFDENIHSVGSTLAAGKGLTITSKKDITLQGADVKAQGEVDLTGQNVNIMAAQDIHTSTSTSTTTKTGLYLNSSNNAGANADAGTTAGAAPGSVGTSADTNANAKAASNNSIDVMRTKTTDTATQDVTNTGTSLASGGTLRINSAKALTVQGSDVSGEQGVDVKAKDMQFLAAQDTHSSTTSTSSTSTGLYVDGASNAGAGTTAGAKASIGANAGAKAEASADAKLSVGVQVKTAGTTDTENTSTARVSTITSGSGSITRTAENKITDVGTAIDAAGDFRQSAATIESRAAENTASKTHSDTTNVGKVGVYAKAQAGATATAGATAGLDGAQAGADAKATGSVGAGVSASYARDANDSSSSASNAVVSTIKSGGKVTSVSAEKTSFEGTQISAGKGVEIEAGSLDFSAAKNTTASSSSTSNVNAQASVGLSRGTGKGVDVDLAAGASGGKAQSDTSTAIAGSISSGDGISIKTKDDTRLQGTNLSATGDTSVAAGGNLILDAARDTTSASASSYDASASLSVGKSSTAGGSSSKGGVQASGGFSNSKSESSTATAGSISSGGTVSLSAGKAATLEGTNIGSGGDTTISATDGVNFSAARSTASSESYGGSASVGGGTGSSTNAQGSTSSKSGNAAVAGNYSSSKDSIAEAGSISSGGNLKIVSNKDVTLEGTNLSAAGKASVLAGGNVNFKAAESTSESVGVGVSLSGSGQKTTQTPAAPVKAPAAPVEGKPVTGGTQGADGSAQSKADLAKWQGQQGSVTQQLKDKQGASGTTPTGIKPALPTTLPPALPGATPKLDLSNTAGAGASGIRTATGIKPALPTTPPPALPGSAAAAAASGQTTGKQISVSASVNVQSKNKTTQTAGSITAGAGGVEIVSGGGDVNLVGTKINTTGDANISAARDVNISATKNTDSSIGVSVSATMDRQSQTPAAPVKAPAAAAPVEGKPVTGGTQGADGSAQSKADLAKWQGQQGSVTQQLKDKQGASGTTPTGIKPALPTSPPPALPGATPKLDLSNTAGAGASGIRTATGIKPALPTTPPPALPDATPKLDLTNTAGAGASSIRTATGIKPALPTTPPPALPGATSKLDLTNTAGAGAAGVAAGTGILLTAPAAAAAKDPNTFGGAASVSTSTAKDPDNTSKTFVGVGVSVSGGTKSDGAAINTGGKLNITSGGKTTLTKTNIKAQGGENIDAVGGVERKAE